MTADLKKIVGQRLQRIRREKDLTQEEMSERLNLSTSAYCKIEYGETDLTLTRLNKIAEVFEMSAFDLFNEINRSATFNNCQGLIGYTQHNENVNVGNADDLRELIRANSRIIELLSKRIDDLERDMHAFANTSPLNK